MGEGHIARNSPTPKKKNLVSNREMGGLHLSQAPEGENGAWTPLEGVDAEPDQEVAEDSSDGCTLPKKSP